MSSRRGVRSRVRFVAFVGAALATLALLASVASFTVARSDSARRLAATDVATLATRLDTLGASVLNMDPALRDDDPLAEILEDIDDEAELIDEALMEVGDGAVDADGIGETVGHVRELAEAPNPGGHDTAVILEAAEQLTSHATALRDHLSGVVAPELLAAREATVDVFHVVAHEAAGEELAPADRAVLVASLNDVLEQLPLETEARAFDDEVKHSWDGEGGADGLDQLSEIMASVGEATVLLARGTQAEDGLTAIVIASIATLAFGVWTGIELVLLRRERSIRERHLRFQARRDQLTGLLNRSQIRPAFFESREATGAGVGVLYVDLDGFKAVNDELGHHVGDALLLEVSRRLRAELRSGDNAIRLGGDEFVLLVANVGCVDDVVTVGDRVVESIGAPIVIEGQTLRIGASVGVVYADRSSGEPDELIRDADAALYVAKAQGRGRVVSAASGAS